MPFGSGSAASLPSSRRRQLSGYFVLLVVASAGFMLGGPPEDTIFWNGLFDVGHAILFGLLTWAALRAIEVWYAPKQPPHLMNLAALAGIVFAAALSELVQRFQPTRHPSMSDFLRDLAGAGAVMSIWTAARFRLARRHSLACWGLAFALVATILGEFGLILRLYIERDRSFPVLIRFNDDGWERRLLRVHGGQLMPVDGSGADCARLVLNPGRVPALTFEEPYPDWTGSRHLRVSLVSSVERTFVLRIRVSDAEYNGDDDDAYFEDFAITKGPHHLEIPVERVRNGPARRTLDLRRIRNITMFVWRPTDRIDLCLSPLRLE